jgi:hypothetical protein
MMCTHHRNVAVCMGQHGRLGLRSGLRLLDMAVLHMILRETVSMQLTAADMLDAFDRCRSRSRAVQFSVAPASAFERISKPGREMANSSLAEQGS